MLTSSSHPQVDRESSDPLEGAVERVTFHSEETGFSVLKIKARGHRELVTVVGSLPSVNAGEWIKAVGVWVIDREHGRQLKASHIETTPPESLEGIEKFLGSGLIKGIGPVYANKLVNVFGRDVLDVIEHRSALLEEVEGIGPLRRQRIKQSWIEQKNIRAIMSFLLGIGVSTARAFRIHKVYGEHAIEKIRMDPYCLARDIHGIGFQTADRIAEQLGVARDSDLRARAGITYTLMEFSEQGHCAYPLDALVAKAGQLLGIGEEKIRAAVSFELGEGRVTQGADSDGSVLMYLTALDRAEQETATRLARLLKGAHPCLISDLDAALKWVQQQIHIELSDGQKNAFRVALTSKVSIVTGGPGVGKTTLVKAILRTLQAKKMKIALCAPTGRAAKRMAEVTGIEAKTMHRMLAFDPGVGRFRFDQNNPLSEDVFIVDETSMIDLPLMTQLLRAIPSRAALVLVGDADQLPSVGPGYVLNDLIQSNVIPVGHLSFVFRQAEQSDIVKNAHRINEGHMPIFPEKGTDGRLVSSDCYFLGIEDAQVACQRIVQLVSRILPARFGFSPREDIQVLTPMQKGDLGARHLNVMLQQALNPVGPSVERFGWVFRAGDRVMQMENNYDKDVFNGDVGLVHAVDEVGREITVIFDDRKVVYDFQELDELSLSYAVTIHKSQGSEYPCVVVPVHTQHFVLLQRNLLYTALTRGKKMVVIIGARRALGMAVHRADAGRRITTLKARVQSACAAG